MAMPQPEDPMAHEIIVLPPQYHLSVHYPRSSMYADVWLGINMGSEDLLIYLSPLRRKTLNTSPPEQVTSDGKTDASGARARRDSVCDDNCVIDFPVRHTNHGLFNCPANKSPLEWLVSKETLFEAKAICQTHYAKFAQALAKVQKRSRTALPDLAPLLRQLDGMLETYNANPGPMESPTCGICSSSPYTRLFFSML
ncbi:hypothetical protein LPJ61_000831 [Coemansia biformis]|uniref:Uncharacterized protein n=1 Tax=Coemansia biformis TaxID=1286918 RepID=A0A9W7YH68_9FUNG|nr:hypothetical protein LPJ61_000831 [Coemansia biformis]